MSSSPSPKTFEQPILPGWFVTNITERNSNDPDTERAIVASQSYGRQLGRMMDAIALLIDRLPETERQAEAFQEFACHSACKIGSDSFLMKFAGRLWFSNGESAPCGRAFKSHR